MTDPLNATASDFENLNRQFEVVAHNLANVSTTGYKRQGISFSSVLAEQTGGGVARWTKPTTTGMMATDFAQGSLIQTGRPLDAALAGEGFFVVETPEGRRFTRNGSFRPNSNGQIVDSVNRVVAGEGGPITVPGSASPRSIRIASDGTVVAAGGELGKLLVVGFADPSVLRPVGQGCFMAADDAQPDMTPDVQVLQGYKEASNVNLVEELVALIQTTRLFEANLKTISIVDDQMQSILELAMS